MHVKCFNLWKLHHKYWIFEVPLNISNIRIFKIFTLCRPLQVLLVWSEVSRQEKCGLAATGGAHKQAASAVSANISPPLYILSMFSLYSLFIFSLYYLLIRKYFFCVSESEILMYQCITNYVLSIFSEDVWRPPLENSGANFDKSVMHWTSDFHSRPIWRSLDAFESRCASSSSI